MADTVDATSSYNAEYQRRFERDPDEEWAVEVYYQPSSYPDYSSEGWEVFEEFGSSWEDAKYKYEEIKGGKVPVRLGYSKGPSWVTVKEYWP